jgi:DsbC/DsbD-like thiol-disulfide interchange protein
MLCLPLFSLAQQNKLAIAPPDALTVKRGTTATEDLKVEVLPGFHVNSDHPKDEFLIPLKLTWQDGPLQTTSVSFPKPEEIQVGAEKLLVFTGTFQIRTEFAVAPDAPTGTTTITGKVRYQACSNQMCFRPASLEVKLPVTVE